MGSSRGSSFADSKYESELQENRCQFEQALEGPGDVSGSTGAIPASLRFFSRRS